MAVNRIPHAGNPPSEANGAAKPGIESTTAAAPKGGSFELWLPLIINIVLMPALAYALTVFVIVPRLRNGESGESASKSTAEKSAGTTGGKKDEMVKTKIVAPLSSKVLVNLAGTMGTRYLLANVSLVGAKTDFKADVEKNDAQLRDAAAGTLSTKSIADLEKPGSRNLIRTELINVFNSVLGEGTVVDIYLTEFAIQ